MPSLATLLVPAALALAPIRTAPSAGPTLGSGEQTVTVVLQGVGGDQRVEAEDEAVGTLLMADPGTGAAVAHFHRNPSRTLHLRLTSLTTGRQTLLDESVPLVSDGESVLTYAITSTLATPRAVRVPTAPSAGVPWAGDTVTATEVRFGWAALAFLYVVGLGALWARRA